MTREAFRPCRKRLRAGLPLSHATVLLGFPRQVSDRLRGLSLSTSPFSERNSTRAYAAHDQMPAVAHLPRLWSALTNSRSIFRGTVTADHLNRGMLLQPGFDAVGRTVREQINGPTLLQVTDQRPVPQTAFVCPIIQTNHARGSLRRLFPATNQTQDGIATSAEALFASSVGPGLTSDSESELTEGFLQPVGALSVRTTELWESFSENLLRTGALFTEKTTDMQDETDRTPTGGEISQGACVPTLDVRRWSPTGGAGSHWRRGTQGQGDLTSYLYLFNLDIRKVGKNEHRRSLGPQKWKGKTKKCSISQYTTSLISEVA